MSTGQDPTHAVTHIPGFLPQNKAVMCLVHGGKSIRQNLSLREPCGTGEGLLSLSKMVTPPEAVVRSEIS